MFWYHLSALKVSCLYHVFLFVIGFNWVHGLKTVAPFHFLLWKKKIELSSGLSCLYCVFLIVDGFNLVYGLETAAPFHLLLRKKKIVVSCVLPILKYFIPYMAKSVYGSLKSQLVNHQMITRCWLTFIGWIWWALWVVMCTIYPFRWCKRCQWKILTGYNFIHVLIFWSE